MSHIQISIPAILTAIIIIIVIPSTAGSRCLYLRKSVEGNKVRVEAGRFVESNKVRVEAAKRQ